MFGDLFATYSPTGICLAGVCGSLHRLLGNSCSSLVATLSFTSLQMLLSCLLRALCTQGKSPQQFRDPGLSGGLLGSTGDVFSHQQDVYPLPDCSRLVLLILFPTIMEVGMEVPTPNTLSSLTFVSLHAGGRVASEPHQPETRAAAYH